MNLITKLAYNPITKAIQAILPGGVTVKMDQSESGLYTPIASDTSNCSVTPRQCLWSRVGNVVTVSGAVDVDIVASGQYNFQLTLPIASDFTSVYDVAGIGNRKQGGTYQDASVIVSSVANNKLSFEGNGTDTDSEQVTFCAQYVIK